MKKFWLWFGIGLIIVAAEGALAYYRFNLVPANRSDGRPVIFEIKGGEQPTGITAHLRQAGLIRSEQVFMAYLTLHGLRHRLQAGVYQLSPNQSSQRIARIIANGEITVKRLTVPEGTNLNQLTNLAEKQGLSKAAFKAALDGAYPQQFLSARPPGVSLEGYLYPDTYQLNPNTTAAQTVNLMLDNFGRQLTPELIRAFKDRGLSLHEGLTLASIVEKEVSIAADRPKVAQVLYNRLSKDMPLELDTTVIYAADITGTTFNLDSASPYNTYRVHGLPPGPICNPGLGALKAAAHPEPNDFLYFISGKDGQTYFARTAAEHQDNIKKHLK